MQIAQRLAHPGGPDRCRGARAGAEGKAFVHIDGGLHSTEVAGGQHTLQLAYDLLAHADDPKIKPILDNVILMLWPSINPDGQNIVVEVVHGERRHAVRDGAADGALSEVRRPRQQPRRLHAEHGGVARDVARVAALGAADHLRPPPVVAVPDAHLAAAVRRADRAARAGADVARR